MGPYVHTYIVTIGGHGHRSPCWLYPTPISSTSCYSDIGKSMPDWKFVRISKQSPYWYHSPFRYPINKILWHTNFFDTDFGSTTLAFGPKNVFIPLGQHGPAGGDPGEPSEPDSPHHGRQGGGAGPSQPRLPGDIRHGPGHRGGETVRVLYCSLVSLHFTLFGWREDSPCGEIFSKINKRKNMKMWNSKED